MSSSAAKTILHRYWMKKCAVDRLPMAQTDRKSTIGSRDDIEKVPVDRLEAFYKKYYQPDNALLIITGQIDAAKTLAMVADTMGKATATQPSAGLTLHRGADPGWRTLGDIAARGATKHQSAIVAFQSVAVSHPDVNLQFGVLAGANTVWCWRRWPRWAWRWAACMALWAKALVDLQLARIGQHAIRCDA